MMNFNSDHVQALQAPYAQQIATATCQQAQQSWTEAKGLLSKVDSLCWHLLTLGLCVHLHWQARTLIIQVTAGVLQDWL